MWDMFVLTRYRRSPAKISAIIKRAMGSNSPVLNSPIPIKPASRISGKQQDVWSIINNAIANSPIHPVINMGQGSLYRNSDYNPPDFVLDAARLALLRVDCNQYAPTMGRPRLLNALAGVYSNSIGRKLDPQREITITTGANEGMLSAFMGLLDPGDEVIVFEPFFDQYISNIEMAGGKVVYVPLHPPPNASSKTTPASEWTVDFSELREAFTSRTKMLIVNTPNNPTGKIFSADELRAIGDLCVKHNTVIIADEVYDKLTYIPFTRIGSLSPSIARLTLTVGSVGKHFYATGWRVGFLIGPEDLIACVRKAHTRVCFVSPSVLQEAAAVGYEVAEEKGFWRQAVEEIDGKMKSFCEVWDELGLPYSVPDGGYFVLVNMKKVRLPDTYVYPEHISTRPRDFKLAWFLINELGVAAIPPSEFFTDANARIVEDWLRFAVCRTDDRLKLAKDRLMGLKKYIT